MDPRMVKFWFIQKIKEKRKHREQTCEQYSALTKENIFTKSHHPRAFRGKALWTLFYPYGCTVCIPLCNRRKACDRILYHYGKSLKQKLLLACLCAKKLNEKSFGIDSYPSRRPQALS